MKLEVKGINKSYRGRGQILKQVAFEASDGECVGILGMNGCGKTTLLSILAGVQKADSGTFCLDGMDILKNPGYVKRYIGYVPQGNPLMEELSAWDNLRLWYADCREHLSEELDHGFLAMLGIPDFLSVRVSHMSGGMKKRLSIGCAVAHCPKILFLDEPGAALDLLCKERIESYLREFKKQGGIIVMATHEEREIALLDSLYIMKEGSLVRCEYDGNVHHLAGKL